MGQNKMRIALSLGLAVALSASASAQVPNQFNAQCEYTTHSERNLQSRATHTLVVDLINNQWCVLFAGACTHIHMIVRTTDTTIVLQETLTPDSGVYRTLDRQSGLYHIRFYFMEGPMISRALGTCRRQAFSGLVPAPRAF